MQPKWHTPNASYLMDMVLAAEDIYVLPNKNCSVRGFMRSSKPTWIIRLPEIPLVYRVATLRHVGSRRLCFYKSDDLHMTVEEQSTRSNQLALARV